jgi:hypothetical protein
MITIKYATLILVTFSLSIFMAPLSFAQEPSDEVWVSIAATLKGIAMPPIEYYGTLNRKVFEETLARTIPSGFLKLRHAAWMEGGRLHRLSEATQDGATYGYSDVLYLRVETVTRIIELDPSFVKQHLLQTK